MNKDRNGEEEEEEERERGRGQREEERVVDGGDGARLTAAAATVF